VPTLPTPVQQLRPAQKTAPLAQMPEPLVLVLVPKLAPVWSQLIAPAL
jgi:hypothetical protein